jgi:xanthine dehydrogenase YagR molybdenum-binding subunit
LEHRIYGVTDTVIIARVYQSSNRGFPVGNKSRNFSDSFLNGRNFRMGDANAGETYASILQQAGKDFIEVEESSGMPLEIMKYSMASYGAQFCEVRVNEESGEVRVSRWLGSFDCGRILNPKTASSQFRGGIIMGIAMALAEETVFDERRGRIVNRSLAEYHVPVHLDVPRIEITFPTSILHWTRMVSAK